ncbi:MAG: hypothetical protein IBX72_08580 [Nitrospirae bacterium]|nr:hypothetical protein [Nitrospirota bacterium]
MKTPRLKHVVIVSGVLVIALSLFWFIRGQLIKKIPEGLIIAIGPA